MAEQDYELEFQGYWIGAENKNIPYRSGIYCVYSCVDNKDGETVYLKKLIYIGESDNVSSRIANHDKKDDWGKHVKKDEVLCFSFAPVPSTSRVRCEAAIIFKHKPPVNIEYTRAFPYDKTTVTITGKSKFLVSNFSVLRT